MPSSNRASARTALKALLALCVAVMAGAPAFAAAPAPAPGEDFFTYVNGDWYDSTEIPPDKSSWGAGAALAEETDARIVKLIDGVASDSKASPQARKAARFYAAYMDEAGIEAKGIAPLRPLLARIAGVKDKAGLAQLLGASLRADVDPLNATNFFTENLFGLWVAQGLNDPAHYTPYLLQGGLGMPERAYYLADNARMAELRAKYQAHIAAMLQMAGYADGGERAARVFELEHRIAGTHASREDSEDVAKANNPWHAADFARKAPGIDWDAFFHGADLGRQQGFIVWHPGAVSGAAALVAAMPLQTWKDFLSFHAINHFSSVLPKAFGEQHFEFYGRALTGTPQQALRWKRALAATNIGMADAVGQLYVAHYFPPQAKLRLQQMVGNIVAAFGRRIERLEWMAPATREQAQAKLKSLYVGVAYPDRWVSYAALHVSATDAFGNALRAEQLHTAQQLAKLRQPVDRSEWSMPPQLVNAVNMPMQNALNFPAAILQPPFFDPNASDAVNYGGIGATIGHEISHSFDDQGAQFDAGGRLRDWWTASDLAHFKAASARLVAQYSAYRPFPDLAVNGQQTLSENLADLAGLDAAHDAFLASLAGKPDVADAERQFFIGYAQSWRSKTREAALRQQILTDGHAPARYRTATVRNIDAWYRAFDVQPGQALYLAPAERVRVW